MPITSALDSLLGGNPPAAAVEASEPARAAPVSTHLAFTGTGAEYFRIWIVHALLTVVTLGVYSAWAKVRKAKWFAQHTRLLGDAFDYHGQPRRILLGRAIALALFVGYSRAFEWSRPAELVFIAVALVLGPILFNSAQRFRLGNTSWRGVRFGFDAPRWKVYAVFEPLLLVWTAGTLWTALRGSSTGLGWVTLGAALAWPAVHATYKRMQHQQARFGDLRFRFEPAIGAFYGLYLASFGIGLALLFGLGVAAGMTGSENSAASPPHASEPVLYYVTIGLAFAALVYTIVWPYFTARAQQIVWSRTTCSGVRFNSDMSASRYLWLVVRHMLLVVLTAGLYWPFAAVAFARYRVESLRLEAADALTDVVACAQPGAGTVGDAAFDLFGLDLGW